jgi:hypothetical protein
MAECRPQYAVVGQRDRMRASRHHLQIERPNRPTAPASPAAPFAPPTHTCVICRLSWLPRRMVMRSRYRTLRATSSDTVSTEWYLGWGGGGERWVGPVERAER